MSSTSLVQRIIKKYDLDHVSNRKFSTAFSKAYREIHDPTKVIYEWNEIQRLATIPKEIYKEGKISLENALLMPVSTIAPPKGNPNSRTRAKLKVSTIPPKIRLKLKVQPITTIPPKIKLKFKVQPITITKPILNIRYKKYKITPPKILTIYPKKSNLNPTIKVISNYIANELRKIKNKSLDLVLDIAINTLIYSYEPTIKIRRYKYGQITIDKSLNSDYQADDIIDLLYGYYSETKIFSITFKPSFVPIYHDVYKLLGPKGREITSLFGKRWFSAEFVLNGALFPDYEEEKKRYDGTNFLDFFAKEKIRTLKNFYNEIVNAYNILLAFSSGPYLDDIEPNTIIQRNKKHKYVVLRFLTPENEYKNFTFKIDTFDSFMEKLVEAEDKKVTIRSYSDSESSMNHLDFSRFTIHEITQGEAGAEDEETTKYISKYFKIKKHQIRQRDRIKNNCFFDCMKDAKISPTPQKDGKRNLRIPSPKTIKALLDINENDMISISHMNKLEEIYNKKFIIFGDTFENEILYGSTNLIDYDNLENGIIALLLIRNHFYYIEDRKKIINESEKKPNKAYHDIIVSIDFETIYDNEENNRLRPYSCSIFPWDPKEEFKYDPNRHIPKFIYGFDTMTQLFDLIKECGSDERFIFLTFNGSKFDNYFLVEEAAKREILSDVRFTDGKVSSFIIDGKHTMLDIRRFLAPDCSLDKACKDYKTTPMKVEGFDHKIPQKAHEEGKLMNWINEHRRELREYNNKDVLSLLALTMTIRKDLLEETGKDILTNLGRSGKILPDGSHYLNVSPYMTLNQLLYKDWCDKLKSRDITVPAPKNLEDDRRIRRAMYGGRCQSYFGKQKIDKGIQCRMVDATSLYPTVMWNEDYPKGEYEYTDEYREGYLGCYRCDIIHQNSVWNIDNGGYIPNINNQFAPLIVPKRTEGESLDWFYRGSQENIELCSIDIEMIKKWCGNDAIKIHEGIYWKNKATNGSMFVDFLTPFKNIKIREDELKEKGSNDYNSAKREMSKLGLNGLSGKVGQKNYIDFNRRVNSPNDIDIFFDKARDDSLQILKLTSQTMVFQGKLKEEKIYDEKKAKPSYISVFIYAYARRYMYEKLLGRYIVLYQDTDSALMTLSEYERFKSNNPKICFEKDSKEYKDFGTFKEEIVKSKSIITISPKNYLVESENEKYSKRKFKGIRSRDYWLPLEEIPQFKNLINNKTSEEIEEMIKKGRLRLSMNDIKEFMQNQEIKKYPTLCDEMYEYLYEGKKIVVFSDQLRKIRDFKRIKGNHDNEDLYRSQEGKISIQQIYLIKIY